MPFDRLVRGFAPDNTTQATLLVKETSARPGYIDRIDESRAPRRPRSIER